jgi:drug/metabolite transporter (DMT)-like permease
MMAFGFTWFARLRGLARPAVLAGLVAYAVSAVANVGAATINGFAMPWLAGHNASHEAVDVLWAMNQALATLGVVATGLAYALWSLDLWRRWKAVALLGLLAGGVPAVLLIGGWIDMHLRWAILVYASQVLWAALIGWLLLRGSLAPDEKAGD